MTQDAFPMGLGAGVFASARPHVNPEPAKQHAPGHVAMQGLSVGRDCKITPRQASVFPSRASNKGPRARSELNVRMNRRLQEVTRVAVTSLGNCLRMTFQPGRQSRGDCRNLTFCLLAAVVGGGMYGGESARNVPPVAIQGKAPCFRRLQHRLSRAR